MELLKFASLVGKLKNIKRKGWIIRKIKNPESVADHSFRLAILAWLYAAEFGLNVEKSVKLALIHDICEIYTKDIPTESDNKAKVKIEDKAMEKALAYLPEKFEKELYKLWQEYLEKKSKEARLVNELDKIEMVLQALEYSKTNKIKLDEFFETAKKMIKTPAVKKLFNRINEDYKKYY